MRLFLPLLALLAACETRAPLTRGQVAAIADNVQRAEGLAWGDPIEVLPPGLADAQGRRWWQLRYPGGEGGAERVLVVDDVSGWGRLPPAGYLMRLPAWQPPRPGVPQAVALAEGSHVLVLAGPEVVDAAQAGVWEREAARLNALAGGSGLYPVFSVHRDRQGRSSLVYGWQGDRGMAKDEKVRDWLRARTAWKDAWWADLLGE